MVFPTCLPPLELGSLVRVCQVPVGVRLEMGRTRQRAGVFTSVPVWGRGRAGSQFLTRPVPLPFLLGARGGPLPLCAWGALTPIPSPYMFPLHLHVALGRAGVLLRSSSPGLWSLGILLDIRVRC